MINTPEHTALIDLRTDISKPVRHNLRRIRKFYGFSYAIGKAYKLAYQHQAHKKPNQPFHLDLIQDICHELCSRLDVHVIPHGEIPTHHALWVSNHVSWLDPCVLGSVIKSFYIGKIEVADWPVIGFLARAAGTLFIRRGSGDAGSVAEQMAQFLKQRFPLLFFPEATTTNGKHIHKIYGKLLDAALLAQVPVQPVIVLYQGKDGQLDRVLPWYDDSTFMANLMKVFAHGAVFAHVQALEAIDPTGHDRDSLTQLLKHNMDAGYAKLHFEVFGKEPDIEYKDDMFEPWKKAE